MMGSVAWQKCSTCAWVGNVSPLRYTIPGEREEETASLCLVCRSDLRKQLRELGAVNIHVPSL